MRILKNVCRKEQGRAEEGNTCLETPGTCESCPNWWKNKSAATPTPGPWRIEAISDCVRIVVGTGRKKIIIAKLNPKQIPESETLANARLIVDAVNIQRSK